MPHQCAAQNSTCAHRPARRAARLLHVQPAKVHHLPLRLLVAPLAHRHVAEAATVQPAGTHRQGQAALPAYAQRFQSAAPPSAHFQASRHACPPVSAVPPLLTQNQAFPPAPPRSQRRPPSCSARPICPTCPPPAPPGEEPLRLLLLEAHHHRGVLKLTPRQLASVSLVQLLSMVACTHIRSAQDMHVCTPTPSTTFLCT